MWSIELDNDSVIDVEHLRMVSKLIAGLGNQIELSEGFLKVIKLELQLGILVAVLVVDGTGGREVGQAREGSSIVGLEKRSDVFDSCVFEEFFCHLCNVIISQI